MTAVALVDGMWSTYFGYQVLIYKTLYKVAMQILNENGNLEVLLGFLRLLEKQLCDSVSFTKKRLFPW